MKREPLSFNHQPLLDKKLKMLGNGLSEYCFSNLYLFREVHNYHILTHDNIHFFVNGKTYDGFSFLMPAFDLKKTNSEYLAEIINGFDYFFPISETMLSCFDRKKFTAHFNTDDSDYVYTTDKLKTYRGRKLAVKKNLMRQFLKNHTPSITSLNKDTKKDALAILQQWQEDTAKPATETDFHPCLEALHRIESLDLSGHIYYADGEPGGFVLTREVIPRMCVFHFAKGKRKFKGIFQYMFNQHANAHDGQFDTYNFEQDLGKANFRQTKLSYKPDKLLNKYRVKLR